MFTFYTLGKYRTNICGVSQDSECKKSGGEPCAMGCAIFLLKHNLRNSTADVKASSHPTKCLTLPFENVLIFTWRIVHLAAGGDPGDNTDQDHEENARNIGKHLCIFPVGC